jgi:hypothetical protein
MRIDDWISEREWRRGSSLFISVTKRWQHIRNSNSLETDSSLWFLNESHICLNVTFSFVLSLVLTPYLGIHITYTHLSVHLQTLVIVLSRLFHRSYKSSLLLLVVFELARKQEPRFMIVFHYCSPFWLHIHFLNSSSSLLFGSWNPRSRKLLSLCALDWREENESKWTSGCCVETFDPSREQTGETRVMYVMPVVDVVVLVERLNRFRWWPDCIFARGSFFPFDGASIVFVTSRVFQWGKYFSVDFFQKTSSLWGLYVREKKTHKTLISRRMTKDRKDLKWTPELFVLRPKMCLTASFFCFLLQRHHWQ